MVSSEPGRGAEQLGNPPGIQWGMIRALSTTVSNYGMASDVRPRDKKGKFFPSLIVANSDLLLAPFPARLALPVLATSHLHRFRSRPPPLFNALLSG